MSVTLSQGDSARERQKTPATLAEAHDLLWRQRPAPGTDLRDVAEYHRHSAQVYSKVASVDLRHHHEALQCAGLEIRKARGIEHRLDPSLAEGEDW